MILSDRELKQLSTPPDYLIEEQIVTGDNTIKHMTTGHWGKDVSQIEKNLLSPNQINTMTQGVISYRTFPEESKETYACMINPFVDHQVRQDDQGNRVVSYGLSSYGYDIRIANEFKIFTNVNNTKVDPKDFDERSFVDFTGDVCVIPPNSFVLARSVEYFKMPEDVTGIVLGKSTYARCGCSCLATPLEAGWEGHVTLEFANTTPLPLYLYANEGAAQVIFYRGNPCEVSYATRGGKYQGQQGITLPRM